MSQDVQELVRFTELYQESLERIFRQAVEKVGDLGLPRPAFEVRTFRVLEPRFGRERLSGRRRDPAVNPAVRRLQAADLYLAVAVGESLPEAIKRIQDWHGDTVRELAVALCEDETAAESMSRGLWEALLRVAPPPAPPPLIAAYDGRPSLKSWLRVVTLRSALEKGLRTRGSKPRTELPETEQALLNSHERQAIDTALAGVMAREPTSHRLLFTLKEVERLSVAEGAHLVGSEPRRVQAALVRLHKRLRAGMEKMLRTEHGYDTKALDNYWKRAARLVKAES